ncbi:MAG TPA: xanthine dehydrogenase family protein subunit M [Planctomycetota bacterium]|jgi:xanthine dehydrogenase YagS FAD-binding subunit|nr:xanthine dehydrogenase family protein subunit M [Planctomycetota bacterium]
MKAFTLKNPTSLAQAIEILGARTQGAARGSHGKLQVLAGGQDLLTEMKEHLVEPEVLVNLKGIGGLDAIQFDAQGALSIGALATLTSLEEHEGVRSKLPMLAEAARSIASPQIRSVGTVGGNLCQRPRCWYYRNEHAKCLKKGGSECFSYSGLNKYNAILGGGPSYIVHPSDLAPALVALEARATLRGPAGEREVPLERFFTLPTEGSVLRENVLAEDEILVRVTVPAPAAGMRGTYLKFKERGSFDFALASVAVGVAIEGGKISKARLVLGGVAPIPWRAPEAEAALVGQAMGDTAWKAAGEAAVRGAEPLAHNAYKVPLAKGLVFRALQSLSRA